MSFDGVDDYVSVSHNATLNIPTDLSISLWLKPMAEHVGYAAHPFNKWFGTENANYVLYYFGTTSGLNRIVEFAANAGGVWQGISGLYTVTLNEWVHVALSYTSTSGGQLYINGSPFGVRYGSGSLATNAADLNISKTSFPGLIDDVRIYNRALSDAEIKAIYDATK